MSSSAERFAEHWRQQDPSAIYAATTSPDGIALMREALPHLSGWEADGLAVYIVAAGSLVGAWEDFESLLELADEAAPRMPTSDRSVASVAVALARLRWHLATDRAPEGAKYAAELADRGATAYLRHVAWTARGLWALRDGGLEHALGALERSRLAFDPADEQCRLVGPSGALFHALSQSERGSIEDPRLREYARLVAAWRDHGPYASLGEARDTTGPSWRLT